MQEITAKIIDKTVKYAPYWIFIQKIFIFIIFPACIIVRHSKCFS